MFQRLFTIACGIACLFCLGLNTVVARQDDSSNPLRRSTPPAAQTRENVQPPSAPQSSDMQTTDDSAVDATQELKLKALTQLYPTRREGDLSNAIPKTFQRKLDPRVIPIAKPTIPNNTSPANSPTPDVETSPSQPAPPTKPIIDRDLAPTAFNSAPESTDGSRFTFKNELPSDPTTNRNENKGSFDSPIITPAEPPETQSGDRPVTGKVTLGEYLGSTEKIKQEREGNAPSPEFGLDDQNQLANDEASFAGSSNDFVEKLQKIATRTCLVLILGVGFILIAKRFSIGKSTVAKSNTKKTRTAEQALNFRMVGHFKLSAKSNLQIIEVGDQKFLIANDSTGIKSVVPIGTPFVNTLDDLANAMSEKANDEPDETVTYTPSARLQSVETSRGKRANSTNTNIGQTSSSKTNADVEEDMRRQLAELLGGQAFKDVFYQQTKTAT